jgi:hypothetical protein
VRGTVPGRVDSWLLLATAVGLFGCPLLLEDRFSTVHPDPDVEEPCLGGECVPPSNDVGGSSGAGGGGGSGSSSTGGNAGSASTGGTTSSGGSGGASGGVGGGGAGGGGGSVDAGGGQGGAEPCRTLELTSTAYGTTSNCIGVHGSSNVVTDTDTEIVLSYDDGDPCFTGAVGSSGWAAVYELTFAGDDDGDTVWNAIDAGVTGFEFATRGSEQPSSLKVIYKDPSGVDNCHFIGSGTTPVPFSIAHPGCGGSGATVDSDRLVELILAFPQGSSYAVDFCVQISAID